jgi:DNA polymerase III epsilon subunit family exonuclease
LSVLNNKSISAVEFDTALEDMEFISFDVETTGLSPIVAKLVELSGVKFRLGDSNVSTFSSLINPESAIPAEVTAIHGITDEMVYDAPRISAVIPAFLEWIGSDNTVLVAHNAPFDLGFLRVAIAKLRLTVPGNWVIDTLPLARRVLVDAPNHRLKTLVEFLALEAGGYHRALADSHHVKNILNHMASAAYGLTTWDALNELGCVSNFNREEADEWGVFETPQELLDQVESIRQAILDGASVSFVYKGMQASRRRISPIAVIKNRGNFYLTGNCHRILEERTFRLDKIFELQIFGT